MAYILVMNFITLTLRPILLCVTLCPPITPKCSALRQSVLKFRTIKIVSITEFETLSNSFFQKNSQILNKFYNPFFIFKCGQSLTGIVLECGFQPIVQLFSCFISKLDSKFSKNQVVRSLTGLVNPLFVPPTRHSRAPSGLRYLRRTIIFHLTNSHSGLNHKPLKKKEKKIKGVFICTGQDQPLSFSSARKGTGQISALTQRSDLETKVLKTVGYPDQLQIGKVMEQASQFE